MSSSSSDNVTQSVRLSVSLFVRPFIRLSVCVLFCMCFNQPSRSSILIFQIKQWAAQVVTMSLSPPVCQLVRSFVRSFVRPSVSFFGMCFNEPSSPSILIFQIKQFYQSCYWSLMWFLAAMSSSSSDNVTQSVRPSVAFFDFKSKSLVHHALCT